jgi:outer membrane lipoprotein-sorting protein
MHRQMSRLALALSLFSVVATTAHAQTVDEIVAKNLQAKGGAEKWQSVNSVKMTGKIASQGQEMPLTMYAKRPNKSRQEISLPDGKIVQAFDGTTAWVINPMTGINAPQPMPSGVAEMMKNGADFDGALINYKSKGHTIELVGKEKLADVSKEKPAGRDVYHLKITMKSGQVQHYFLDAESGLELKTSAEVDMGMGGPKQTLDTEMSNYKAEGGIMLPHTVKQFVNGKPLVEMLVMAVEFNAPVDDAMFTMPAAK